MKTKNSLRLSFNKKRKNLSKEQVIKKSNELCKRISKSQWFLESKTIALYHPISNEVDLLSLLTPALIAEKTFLLPVVNDGFYMNFKEFDNKTRLVANKYGILEPQDTNIVPVNEIDLCLMPLCGFNRNGARLGMGGGYYDRYFALNKLQKKTTILAGIAYDFQESATIPCEMWDIPLNLIFTNKEVITIT